MIRLRRITTADTELYGFMESLMTEAFPVEEYREPAELREFTDNKECFYNNIIYDGDTPVGLITYWDFGCFHYVEHFAIATSMRNGGYGRKVMELLKKMLPTPIVLEVEMPDCEIAERRIGFYERQGFRLWGGDYCQPPYRQGGKHIPMRLMVFGELDSKRDFDDVRTKIHREVYGYGNSPERQAYNAHA